eukprot:gnl/TRDRNA2_/TRDRNA2_80733_c0_seq2.p1 gnl/TRDRNA2_/TRDRNA2_80733_c0~~gnl/TRDRNA2_/TRDRNA2_80733_c0_seq2.p1  ORF type:complete len:633 (-),score=103.38 gnl/TRDRNA2_/TRDRNA2_80733_c0_seq2:87-1985(-)
MAATKANASNGDSSAGQGSQAVPQLLLRTLVANNLPKTASCLRHELGIMDKDSEFGEVGSRRGALLTPRLQESLCCRFEAANSHYQSQRKRIAEIAEEMSAQHQLMKRQREMVAKLSAMCKPSFVPEETKLRDVQIEQLEAEKAQHMNAIKQAREEMSEIDAGTSDAAILAEVTRENEKMKKQLQILQEEACALRSEYYDLHHVEDSEPEIQYQTQGERIHMLLMHWGKHGPTKSIASEMFKKADIIAGKKTGRLNWTPGDELSNQVMAFIKMVFQQYEVDLPLWPEHVWQSLYNKVSGGVKSIAQNPAEVFVRHCLERMLSELPSAATGGQVHHLVAMAEHNIRVTKPMPVQTQSITYANGVTISFGEAHNALRSEGALGHGAAVAREVAMRKVQSGESLSSCLATFNECDAACNGKLEWNTGEVQRFIHKEFEKNHLAVPTEKQMYMMFKMFDTHNKGCLNATDCVNFMDAFLRTCFAHQETPRSGVDSPRASSVGSSPGTMRRNVLGTTSMPVGLSTFQGVRRMSSGPAADLNSSVGSIHSMSAKSFRSMTSGTPVTQSAKALGSGDHVTVVPPPRLFGGDGAGTRQVMSTTKLGGGPMSQAVSKGSRSTVIRTPETRARLPAQAGFRK